MTKRSQQRNWISRLSRTYILLGLVTVLLSVAIASQPAQAQTFTTLLSLNVTDGANVFAPLIQASNGELYGTTTSGGTDCCGTVFKLTPNGTLTTLYSFCPQTGCTDGFAPQAALVQVSNGDFYGTTYFGGATDQGTIFKITPSGTLTTLYNFCSQSGCTDGFGPEAGLIQASNGDLYGTTFYGGATNSGTIFKINLAGTLTTLYSFCSQSDCTDGANAYAGLVQSPDGYLYGAAYGGGASGVGTIFKITLGGTLTTLHSFDGTDGSFPSASLVLANDGNFYGTTQYGGTNDACAENCGTVFKVTPGGTLTSLHSFDGTDGSAPFGALVQATDGNLYGTTENGGANDACTSNCGTIFRITPSGTLITLHSFDGTDGNDPRAGLFQATNGNLYGGTAFGGAGTVGTLFRLSVGSGPFVETQPVFGNVGASVRILGTNLTGATSVTFNGTAATFTVVSKSEITATVPTGASTGTVAVTTPGGTLNSNTKFTVTP
jgi:uncharacterized repeat protein (TIGR03803 family)